MRKIKGIRLKLVLLTAATFGTACILGFVLGIPAKNKIELSSTCRIVICNLGNDMEAIPKRSITDTNIIHSLVRGLNLASCRLMLPTLGGVRGPAIFLDSDGHPITAFVYQADCKGLIEYEVIEMSGRYNLGAMKMVGRSPLARVIKFDLFQASKSM